VDQGALIGWALERPNRARLFAAIRDGGTLRPKWEVPLPLPDWVEMGSDEPNALVLEAEVQSGLLVVTWEAHSRYRGGAPPPPEVEEAATHDERRTVRLDRETGTVVEQAQVASTPSREQVLSAVTPNRQNVSYRSGTSWATRAWQVGSAEVFLTREGDEPGIALVRREPGDAAGTSETRLTSNRAAEVAVTPDGSMIFIHESGGNEPSWQVFSAETGELVTSLAFDPGTEGVSLVENRVIYLVVEDQGAMRRRSLRCRNLHTGVVIWSYVLDEEARKAPPLPR
jgi:hypothetical protein